MQQITRVILADDFPMFREGIRLLLSKEASINIIDEATDGDELIEKVSKSIPDVVITDIEMPGKNGIAATREIKRLYPEVGVIALTMFGEEHLIVDMMDAGANGYVLKNSKKEELLEAIDSARKGHTYFCDSTTMRLSKMIAKSKSAEKMEEKKFSEKELDIIRLICEQQASKEIAAKTNLTHKTVEKYRDHIMEKTGARNVVGIVIYAIKNGIYKP